MQQPNLYARRPKLHESGTRYVCMTDAGTTGPRQRRRSRLVTVAAGILVMLLALLLLCAYLSWATLAEQNTGGAPAGDALAKEIRGRLGNSGRVVIVAGSGSRLRAY